MEDALHLQLKLSNLQIPEYIATLMNLPQNPIQKVVLEKSLQESIQNPLVPQH
jgi:hypothetical protein